jgi:hypothetical protein
VVNKIKLTVVRKTRERFLSSEFKVWNESRSFSSSSLNEYSVSSALLATVRTFAEMGVILRHFLRLTSPEMPPVFKDSGTRRGAEEGPVFKTLAPVANEVELIRKAAPPPISMTRRRGF